MKFTEEQLQKIRESLLANGVPEDVVEFTISDLEGKETEDEEKESENIEEKEGDPTDKEEGNPDEPKPEDDVPPAAEEEDGGEAAPVVEPNVEEIPPAAVEEEVLAPEVPPVEEAVVAPEVAAPVGYDDTELRTLCEEQKKAIDGLLDRVKSLEDALRQSGVLVDEEGTTPVGAELPSAPANEPDDDPMDDILRELNSRKY